MRSSLALLGAFAAVASAWMPHTRNMTAPDGNSLFERTPTTVRRSAANGTTGRWLPGTVPIRGVNLGSMFVVELWMASTEWSDVLNCGSTQSEFDCVNLLGQSTANTNFANHWGSWITESDFDTMVSYNLNTIRIPVGYWIWESLKYDSEHFPAGGLAYLSQICGWASDRGFYIIIDMHGAPYAQVGSNADTGQLAADPSDSNPDFYQSSQYQRALWFLGNMTDYIHTNAGSTGPMRNVGMLEVVNEPWSGAPSDLLQSLRQSYYPDAMAAVRNVESSLGIGANNELHVQMMNAKWGVGDPTQYLTDDVFAAYDDHRYLKYDPSVTVSQAGYLSASCGDDRGGNTPTVVGEWSLSVDTDAQNDSEFWPIANNLQFYQQWFAAQVRAYEKSDVEGWIFWSWKAQLGDPRWSYTDAVQAGIIPTDLSGVAASAPC